MIAPATACLAAETHPVHAPGWLSRIRPGIAVLAGAAVAVLVVEVVLVAPYLVRALSSIEDANPWWLVLALAAEVGSMASFARLQRVMLRSGGVSVRMRDALATAFAGNAMSVTLPGGSIASFAYTLRRMRSWGASAPLAAFSLAATGVLSTIALTVLAAAGGALAGDSSELGLVVLEVLGIAVLVVGAVVLLSRPRTVGRLAEGLLRVWSRVRPISVATRRAKVDAVLVELSAVHPTPRTWARGLAFASVNWANDLLCLLAASYAVGASPSLGTLLLAYAAGMAAASSVPFLPGGIGAVEPALVLALVHGGVPLATATASVLVYRLISFGLVAAAGWIVLIATQRHRRPARDAARAPIVSERGPA